VFVRVINVLQAEWAGYGQRVFGGLGLPGAGLKMEWEIGNAEAAIRTDREFWRYDRRCEEVCQKAGGQERIIELAIGVFEEGFYFIFYLILIGVVGRHMHAQ
jgi:hypothetical protein